VREFSVRDSCSREVRGHMPHGMVDSMYVSVRRIQLLA